MSIFRTSLRIVAAHRLYVLVYLVLLSMLGLLTAAVASSSQEDGQVVEEDPAVAVIDRDGSTISQGLTSYVESQGDTVSLEDTRRALQDAAAQDRVQYVLIIPEGYGEELVAAAQEGQDPPVLDTVVSYQSATGSRVDVRSSAFLDQVYDHLSLSGATAQEAVTLAREAVDQSVRAEVISVASPSLPERFRVFAEFSLYPLFAFGLVSVSTLMLALSRRPVRSRLASAPTSGVVRSLGVMATCLMVGTVGWLWVLGLGTVAFTGADAADSALPLGLVGLALFSYMLFSVAVGFLLGQLGAGRNVANAVANILGMVLTFLSGAWMPLEYMPDALAPLTRITPSYWVDQVIQTASTAPSLNSDTITTMVGQCAVCTLFALAVFSAGVAVGRPRARSSL
ncbi:ABC transporter permease [Actinomyces lilanjuaniae]|uniref:ABC transporter permease n=1 Tax=Actinomyces lilanjuaniae TaxID=2321394 RepID=A0ABM6Z2D5_9ACTO|nr:ABC transporter permease [Actinomyces lilanjuaniae]AYD89107.1 ABC transporter permease [Actinomyces lilanjuaniae]